MVNITDFLAIILSYCSLIVALITSVVLLRRFFGANALKRSIVSTNKRDRKIKDFGLQLESMRIKLGMTRKTFEKYSGLRSGTISVFEQNPTLQPNKEILKKCAIGLGCPIGFFYNDYSEEEFINKRIAKHFELGHSVFFKQGDVLKKKSIAEKRKLLNNVEETISLVKEG